MKTRLIAMSLILTVAPAFGENRFGRPVIKVRDAKRYDFINSDDVKYPTLSNERFSISCLVYRGTEHYYVEAIVTNKTAQPVALQPSFISFDKPGYTVYETNTMAVAREAAASGDARYVPTPPTYVPPSYNTTVNATATTYGNQTNISGTETTTSDYSGQVGANLGSAIGNAMAARSFYKRQRTNLTFSKFLLEHTQSSLDAPLRPGEARIVVATFDQLKQKKKPFNVSLRVGGDVFSFDFKE